MTRVWLAMLAERLAASFWPVVVIATAFLVWALLGVPMLAPGWPHLVGLAGFAVAAAVAIVRGARRFRPPGWREAERRLEFDSGVRHRPLAVARDRVAILDAGGGGAPGGGGPGGGDERTRLADALWAAHQDRVASGVGGWRVRAPRPTLAARDPWAIRHGVLLALIVAVVVAGDGWRDRLSVALNPEWTVPTGPSAPLVIVDAWLTPPAATGTPPIFLMSGGRMVAGAIVDGRDPVASPPVSKVVPVPQGSILSARVNGGAGAPKLRVNGGEREFMAVDGRGHQIEVAVTGGTEIAITQAGRELGRWPVEVVPDAVPEIGFVTPPESDARRRINFEYVAEDDHGLDKLELELTLAPEVAPPGHARAQRVELTMPGGDRRRAHDRPSLDLTAHPWAGTPVVLTLVAHDRAGQEGRSGSMRSFLPERAFSHPVARAIIAERRRLALEGDSARSDVAGTLANLADAPDAFEGDPVVFLSLVAASRRLLFDGGDDAAPSVIDLLWETAARIEDGGLSQAERDLRLAQSALAEALENGASEEEIRRALDALRAAMDAWLDALEDRAARDPSTATDLGDLPPELAARLTDREELARMMERMRELTETGARDAARRMLSDLRRMLDGARPATNDPQADKSRAQAFDLMRRLRELGQRQGELLDETFRAAQGTDQGGEARGADSKRPDRRGGRRPRLEADAKARQSLQETLRRDLGGLSREIDQLMGEIPDPLGAADREMRDAGEALAAGRPGEAVPSQTQAVEALRRGMEALADQVAQRMMGGMPGMTRGGPEQPGGAGRDPLGRRTEGEGMMDDGGVQVPSDADMARARGILEELRRRAGELRRPPEERDYIERLLRRF